jgi:hypothetical protein
VLKFDSCARETLEPLLGYLSGTSVARERPKGRFSLPESTVITEINSSDAAKHPGVKPLRT